MQAYTILDYWFFDIISRDVGQVVQAVYGDRQPTCVLIGHSMGGAIAVHAAHDQHVSGKLSFNLIHNLSSNFYKLKWCVLMSWYLKIKFLLVFIAHSPPRSLEEYWRILQLVCNRTNLYQLTNVTKMAMRLIILA